MGRVFSAEQVQAGAYPSPADFQTAKEVFTDGVNSGVENGLFYGGEIYGSVAAGMPNVRSDFDGLIIIRHEGEPQRQAARQVVVDVHGETGGRVIVDQPIVQPATGSLIEIDRFFLEALIGQDRIVLGDDPQRYLSVSNEPAQNILHNYIAHKYRTMVNAYNSPELGLDLKGLQRQYELPVALARKAIQAISDVSEHKTEFRGVDKPTVIKLGQDLFNQHQLDETFNNLAELNRLYTELLQGFIDGKIDANQYNQALAEAHAYLPKTIDWLQQVDSTIVPLLTNPFFKNRL
jgi:hypothetical protein